MAELQSPTTHSLVLNGVGAAYLRVFGCRCGRCTRPAPERNLSASLITTGPTGDVVHHALVDAGAGVADSLVESRHLRGESARLDWILLTHWHPDHVNDLNRLLASYFWHRKMNLGQAPSPLPLWCRRETAAWLRRRHAFDVDSFLALQVSAEALPPGHLLPPVPLAVPGVTVTPVTVSHQNADKCAADPGRHCWSCCGYIVETRRTKAVLLWDIDSENRWLAAPRSDAARAAADRLSQADLLFVDCTFWRARPHPTNHATFTHVRQYARTLQPRRTLLVHISGHPDGPGNPGFGWPNHRWQQEAQRVWQAEGLPGAVSVPETGDEFLL